MDHTLGSEVLASQWTPRGPPRGLFLAIQPWLHMDENTLISIFYTSGTNGWKLQLGLTLTTLETAQRTCHKRPEVGAYSDVQRKELRQMDLT